ncbi:uncharacterized protein LOC127241449 [Andrographis paniculata]|uniref:uncharacterized protein LOC127241449 n=1 Tax=Andrographis paniculata TaxID=175694 RepID=UPI0021E7DBE7|nr:uncharacterized protein LOC127241449 [Andrographis paniculata]
MAEEEGEQPGIEQRIECAITSRIQHFKEQADSLTLESVRRLLEKDLALEKFALDAHKRFIRQYLEKKMDSTGDYTPKTDSENVEKDMHLNKEEAATSPKQHETKPNMKKSSSGDEETMEDSPILGVLTPKSETDGKGSSVTESSVKKAIWDRADHFLSNSENITLGGVRRLLEEDLGLAKGSLDPFKKFISQEIDQVLNPHQEAKSAKEIKKKKSQNLKRDESKESSRDASDSSASESDGMEDKVKPRKAATSKRSVKRVEPTKKRKSGQKLDSSGKESKLVKRQKREDNDSDADGSLSEDGQSQSSLEKSSQRQDKSTPGYGKKVENLKSIIRACGMSVAPSIYKKAKQVPDHKREAFIVKELEEILSREGLSKNPTEKEIKNCRKRKETARELEGIDMSNIISSSRRRSSFSFAMPVKPEIPTKKDKVGTKINKKNDSSEKTHIDGSEDEDKEEEKKEVKKVEHEKEKEEPKDEKEEKEGEGDDDEEEVEDDDNDGEEDEEEEEEDEESEGFDEDDNDDSD